MSLFIIGAGGLIIFIKFLICKSYICVIDVFSSEMLFLLSGEFVDSLITFFGLCEISDGLYALNELLGLLLFCGWFFLSLYSFFLLEITLLYIEKTPVDEEFGNLKFYLFYICPIL